MKWQRPIQRKLVGKNPDAFCKFPECPGHWTEHCKSVMNNIEDLIQRGYFQKYKKGRESVKRQSGSGSRGGRQARNNEEHVQKRKETLVIFQKSEISGFEAHLRAATTPRLELMEVVEQEEPPPIPDMTFTREDCRGVSYPHSDPLVMVEDIANQSLIGFC